MPPCLKIVLLVRSDMQTDAFALWPNLNVQLYVSVGVPDFVHGVVIANIVRLFASVLKARVIGAALDVGVAVKGVQSGESLGFKMKMVGPLLVAPKTRPPDVSDDIALCDRNVVGFRALPARDVN